jgi:hypothetical protein
MCPKLKCNSNLIIKFNEYFKKDKYMLVGWMDGWMDGRTDGQTNGRMDGWMDYDPTVVRRTTKL